MEIADPRCKNYALSLFRETRARSIHFCAAAAGGMGRCSAGESADAERESPLPSERAQSYKRDAYNWKWSVEQKLHTHTLRMDVLPFLGRRKTKQPESNIQLSVEKERERL